MQKRPQRADKEGTPSLEPLRFACATHLDKHRRTIVLAWVKQLRIRLSIPTSSNMPDPSYTALTYRALDLLYKKFLAALRDNRIKDVVGDIVANHHEVLDHQRSLQPLLVKLETLGMLIRRSIVSDPTLSHLPAIYYIDRVMSTLQVESLMLFGERRRSAIKKMVEHYKQESQAVGSVLGSCPIGILVTDKEGYITHFNTVQEKISRKKAKDVLGKRLYHEYAYREADEFREAFSQAINKNETAFFSRRQYKSSNGTQYLDITLAPVKDEHGNVNGVVQILEDVSARVDLEAKLREQNRTLTTRLSELEEAYTYIGRINRQFASLIDINTTLSSKLSLDKMLDFIVRSAAMLTKARLTTLRLKNNNGLILAAQYGLSPEDAKRYHTVPVERSMVGRVLREGKKLLLVNLDQDTTFYWPDLKDKFKLKQLISVPLRSRGRIIGVLTIHLQEAREFSLYEQNFLIALANQAALAIDLEKAISDLRAARALAGEGRGGSRAAPSRTTPQPALNTLPSTYEPIRYSPDQATPQRNTAR